MTNVDGSVYKSLKSTRHRFIEVSQQCFTVLKKTLLKNLDL